MVCRMSIYYYLLGVEFSLDARSRARAYLCESDCQSQQEKPCLGRARVDMGACIIFSTFLLFGEVFSTFLYLAECGINGFGPTMASSGWQRLDVINCIFGWISTLFFFFYQEFHILGRLKFLFLYFVKKIIIKKNYHVI